MWNSTNPAEIYSGTTWELLPNDKFLKTGNTPLTQAGSNSIKLTKTNLPTDKLQVEVHSMTRGTMRIQGEIGSNTVNSNDGFTGYNFNTKTGAFSNSLYSEKGTTFTGGNYIGVRKLVLDTNAGGWTGSTSSASPYTAQMGNGTPLTINPEHITVRAWKRLS